VKVIFLDVDGVLNTVLSRYSGGIHQIDDEKVERLSRIVKATGAHIVLSSTWRKKQEDYDMVVAALEPHGLKLYSKTPHKLSASRFSEIRLWLADHTYVTEYAIIDDWEEAEIKGKFFQTDELDGLTEQIAAAVITHLGELKE
jgi:hypothetical protein